MHFLDKHGGVHNRLIKALWVDLTTKKKPPKENKKKNINIENYHFLRNLFNSVELKTIKDTVPNIDLIDWDVKDILTSESDTKLRETINETLKISSLITKTAMEKDLPLLPKLTNHVLNKVCDE